MSDRIKGLWVAFEREIKDEDVECIIEAIKMIRGVENVTTRKVNADDWMIESKLRAKLRDQIMELWKGLG